jgi:hypothetical protein
MASAAEPVAAGAAASETNDEFTPAEQPAPEVESTDSEPPRTAGVLQFGGGFRYGVDMEDAGVDPWKTGLGLNVGYTTYSGLYFGGVFDYFFGETVDVLGTEVSANVWQAGGELGYDVMLGSAVMLRPKLGAGVSSFNVECSQCEPSSESESYFGVAPGATAQFYAGRVILALDARYQLVFADPDTLKALILSFGIGF